MFDCYISNRPEGCGHTDMCKTCEIRQFVVDTLESKNGSLKRKIVYNKHESSSSKEKNLSLSSLKINGVVFLLVEESN